MKRVLNRIAVVCLLSGLLVAISCKKDVTPPVLTTNTPSGVTINSFVAGGNVTKSGGDDVTARGVCWGTSSNPSLSGFFTTNGKGTGNFDASIAGLSPETKYYVRAYATNSAGTAYGNQVSVTTTALVVPTLTTVAASAVTFTTAVTGGNITSDGGAPVSERGICWSTSANPTTGNDKTSDGTGTGSFTSNLAGLAPSTTYHIRAYATNSVGTEYGSDLTFTTTALSIPVLTTAEATNITLTSASSGGNVTSDGGANVTARGICWSKTAAPTIGNDKTTSGSGMGVFTSDLSGLEAGSTYHVRSYATNSVGTGYGNEITFETSPVAIPVLTTTEISAILYTSASSGGVISSDGGASITVKGVCWSTTQNPTTGNDKTSNGTGTGTFTSNMTPLTPGTTYYVRAYATNSAGTGYGNQLSFNTASIGMPTLSTAASTSVTLTSAVSGGNITADGGGTVTARGVCYALTANPTTANSIVASGSGTGTFTSTITGLTPATTYHVRAYATNSAGTSYGEDQNFTTGSAIAPTLSTAAISGVTFTTASSGGNITADGGASVTERGVCWATTPTPTTANSKTSDGSGTGIFTSSITGLNPGTVYHVRAFATNSAGTAYGNDVQFTTTAVSIPTIATAVVTAITANSAISGGNITYNGGSPVIASGICWSTTANPTTSNSVTTDGSASGSFASTMTGLASGTVYYVRAYATNSAGTAYGNQITFGTKVADIEGNLYGVVAIGTQVWMTENLRTATLNDASAIPNVTDATAWTLLSTMAYSWYNNDIANKPIYGGLYNWFAVNTGNLCPTGWHVPSETEFSALELYLGMDPAVIGTGWAFRGTDQGTQLKSTSGWLSGQNGTNTSGFTALPGGYRYAIDGSFNNYTDLAYWWSSTELDATQAWYRRLDGNQAGVYKGAVEKRGGKFVRCLKN
jgi:uncharacterized protein (TIGR02145 family)